MTGSFTNLEIAVYALYLLGGATNSQHVEDIALKCFELAPTVFSWTRYPEYPDKAIVRFALEDAHKKKYGALVDGGGGRKRGQDKNTDRGPSKDGWILTDDGVDWVRANGSRFGDAGKITKDHRQQSRRILKKVREHSAFKKFVEDEQVFSPLIGDLADLLHCRVDSDPGVWHKRFEDLRRHARECQQQDILDFIERSRSVYENQI